jgi:hypothetical protein
MLMTIGLVFLEQPRGEPSPMPRDLDRLARRLASHPTDWRASSAIADRALDGDLPARVETWRAAGALTVQLAPNFAPARTGFARAGLFHWYELGDVDRRSVLTALAPLLRDPVTFEQMAQPIFELTGNLLFLRAAQPRTIGSIETLRNLAVRNGLFDQYRALRSELVATRTRLLMDRLPALPPSQIIAALPLYPSTDDQPMIVTALRALRERPLEVDCGNSSVLENMIDYAVRHRLTPLDGLGAVVRERTWASGFARGQLARALSKPIRPDDPSLNDRRPPHGEVAKIDGVKWDGACGLGFCGRATADVDGTRSLTIESVNSDEIPCYIECYIDDARIWEGPILSKVLVGIGAGQHRVEIRLVNPLMRSRGQRHFRIA